MNETEYILTTLSHLRNRLILLKSKELKSNEIKLYYVTLVNAYSDLRKILKSLCINLKINEHVKKAQKENIKNRKKPQKQNL